jgi:glycosyltransferase involved in cell wall biosynthesis
MKIVYASNFDPNNQRHWSGTGFAIWNSLSNRGNNVVFATSVALPWSVRLKISLLTILYSRLIKKQYLPDRDISFSKVHSKELSKQINCLDNIDAVVTPGTVQAAFLNIKVPLITYHDTTFTALINHNSHFKNISKRSKNHGVIIESAAFKKADACVFSSQWAANSAIRDYNVNPEKVYVVPFGANLQHPPSLEKVEKDIISRDNSSIKLLFIGVEWKRKGGQVAVEVTRCLNNLGIPAHLTIIGLSQEIDLTNNKYVTVKGFLSKASGGEEQILNELAESHFLIVPSTAECYGLVYAEASACGVPAIARDVDGVPTPVKNGRNGRRFGLNASPSEIADWIASTFKDINGYRRLALSSRQEYDQRLNWNVAGASLEQIIQKVVSDRKIKHHPEISNS